MTPRCQGTPSPPGVSAAAAPVACRFEGTPAAPDFLLTAVIRTPGRDPVGGRGTTRDQRVAVPGNTGLVPKHHPKVHPTPAGSPPQEEEIARRPAPPVSRA